MTANRIETAACRPHLSRYGTRQGYEVFMVGLETMIFKSIKLAKDWAAGRGVELVML